MVTMVVVDCWKYHGFRISQIFSNTLLPTKVLTKNEVNVDLC